MRVLSAVLGVSVLLGATASAVAAACPANPDALGTHRVISVDPTEHTRIGTMQYPESLPLADKEVVLTFDDGPLPPYTTRVLEALAAECVKATFFIVGRQARAFPDLLRRTYNEGHTIASHSQNHPLIFTRLPIAGAQAEIENGIASVTAALGNERALAPFFRFPGLGRSVPIENYLDTKGIMTWSADFPADDWTHISAQQVMARALERIERKGRGVLLLHDIQPATVLALPHLLRELKARGYSIVHVVPSGPDRPKTVTAPESWVMRRPTPVWPRVVERTQPDLPAPAVEAFGFPELIDVPVLPVPVKPRIVAGVPFPAPGPAPTVPWPPIALEGVPTSAPDLPAPSARSFGLPRPFARRLALAAAIRVASGMAFDPPDEVFSPLLASVDWPNILRRPTRAAARPRPATPPGTATARPRHGLPPGAAVVPPAPPQPPRLVSQTPPAQPVR